MGIPITSRESFKAKLKSRFGWPIVLLYLRYVRERANLPSRVQEELVLLFET